MSILDIIKPHKDLAIYASIYCGKRTKRGSRRKNGNYHALYRQDNLPILVTKIHGSKSTLTQWYNAAGWRSRIMEFTK